MTDRDSPIDAVLEAARAALHARRAVLVERVERIARALEAYERAVEFQIARGFAIEHSFSRPPASALTPERAAELLEAAVQALPELKEHAQSAPPPPSSSNTTLPPTLSLRTSEPLPGYRFPLLTGASRNAKIVVIGALAGRDKSIGLPKELNDQVEWIDTERDGIHAVGNLPQRVRQGRVAGIVILDRVVQHKHTEPVLAAARDTGVPVAFAGQGGKASFARALEQLETALSTRA